MSGKLYTLTSRGTILLLVEDDNRVEYHISPIYDRYHTQLRRLLQNTSLIRSLKNVVIEDSYIFNGIIITSVSVNIEGEDRYITYLLTNNEQSTAMNTSQLDTIVRQSTIDYRKQSQLDDLSIVRLYGVPGPLINNYNSEDIHRILKNTSTVMRDGRYYAVYDSASISRGERHNDVILLKRTSKVITIIKTQQVSRTDLIPVLEQYDYTWYSSSTNELIIFNSTNALLLEQLIVSRRNPIRYNGDVYTANTFSGDLIILATDDWSKTITRQSFNEALSLMLPSIQLSVTDADRSSVIRRYRQNYHYDHPLIGMPREVGVIYNKMVDQLERIVPIVGYADYLFCDYLLDRYGNELSEIRIVID